MWIEGFLTALQPMNLLYLIAGTAFGMVIGALPGLGPLFGVALMLPLTLACRPQPRLFFSLPFMRRRLTAIPLRRS